MYPVEKTVNETSFKLLTSYINMMIDEKKLPRPVDVTFYLKSRTGKFCDSVPFENIKPITIDILLTGQNKKSTSLRKVRIRYQKGLNK